MRRFRQQQKMREMLVEGDLPLSLRYLDLILVVFLFLIFRDFLATQLAPSAHWLVSAAGDPFGWLESAPSVIIAVPALPPNPELILQPLPRVQLIDV